MSWSRKRSPRRIKFEFKDGKHQPVLLERHVLREIMDRLWLQARIKMYQINQPVGGKVQQNVSGIPDLIGFIPGDSNIAVRAAVPLYIEVKRPGGRHRFHQEVFIQEAKEGGAVAFFAESWKDVVRELGNVGIKLREEL